MAREPTDHELIALEWSLWRAETRFDDDHMQRTLHEDFGEFGRSGRVYARADTLAVPAQPTIDANLRDFVVGLITDDVALLTYVSEVRHGDQLDVANRSSLWLRHDGRWQLRFHQGTPALQ